MSVVPRKPEWTLEREHRRHCAAIRRVMESIRTGECEAETGAEAVETLLHWYEVTGMSIDKPLPGWLRKNKE